MNELKPVASPINNPPVEDEIDLRSLFMQLWSRKGVLFAGVILGGLLALGYLFLATPTYTSDGLLQLEDNSGDSSLLSELMASSGTGPTSSSTQTEKEIIQSRTILGAAIQDLHLDTLIRPEYFPVIGEAVARRYHGEGLASAWLFSGYAWGGEQLRIGTLEIPRAYYGETLYFKRLPDNAYAVYSDEGQEVLQGKVGARVVQNGWTVQVDEFIARPDTRFEVTKLHMETAINNLRQILDIKQLGGNHSAKDIIALELQSDKPQRAAEILKVIINHYVDYKIKADNASVEKTLAFLHQQLQKYANDPTFNPQLYMQMTLKAQELNVMKAGELGNVRVIDYPVAPLKASAPRKPIIMVLGILLGGLLAAMYAVLRISLDRAIYNPQQIETYLNLPVYATVPMSTHQARMDKQAKGGRYLLYREAHDDPAIESLRFLRTAMETGNLRASKHSVIGITGPSPDVGKSFISANLSSLVSELGSKVLLIDGDIRRGVVNEFFNLPKEQGLAEYLAGRSSIDDIIHTTGIDNLDVITRGELPGNPSVLMNSVKLEELLQEVRTRYDYVLIDTPPALSVTDAAVVARYCDRLVIVLRAGKTTIEEVSACWNRLTHAGVTPSGLVMSGFDAKGHGYGVYKHYGYY